MPKTYTKSPSAPKHAIAPTEANVKIGVSMKIAFLTSLILLSSVAHSNECEVQLLERINKDPNIKLIKTIDTYSCGESACAQSFEVDSSPYPNLKVLAFLDSKNNLKVNWVPLNGATVYGHETFKGKKVSYVSTSNVGAPSITIEASIETARDTLFWPPHKIYFQEKLNCIKPR